MKNVSLKLPLLIFILVITSNGEDFGAEARELTEVELMAGSSSDATIANTLDPAHPPCQRDIDCTFKCPKGGFCNDPLGLCDCS
ncbi:hypothetical protein DY000_02004956 [Brassica cretica]|uniref:Defensin-like protein n=1 Tax=Brassica cretica TaxID=69181 RepID=A0ABQ7CIC6_BRACR|nr:hypothetical protein DY000_02004956 [Brassica cretica]